MPGLILLNGNFQYTDDASFIKNDNIIYFVNRTNTAFTQIQCENVIVNTGNLRDVINRIQWLPPTAGNGLHINNNEANSARLVIYKNDDDNWCGIGCDPTGSFHIRVGITTETAFDYRFERGHIYCNDNLLA